MPELNVGLLEATMQYIIDHPEEHDQTWWVCDTTACFAGHAAQLAGWRPIIIAGYCSLVAKDCRDLRVCEAAQNELGLTDEQAAALFSGRNDVEDLQRMVKDLVNGSDHPKGW